MRRVLRTWCALLFFGVLSGCVAPHGAIALRGDDEPSSTETTPADPRPPTASELRYARGIEVRHGMIESWMELVDPPHAPGMLRLRCVDEAGNGIAGAEVRFLEFLAPHTDGTSGIVWHRDGAPHLVSGADGVIEGVAPTELALTIELVVPGRATRQLLRGAIRPGELLDLGTMTFPPGGGVEGLVLDPEGKPCAGLLIGLARPADSIAQGEYTVGWGFVHLRTDASGRFRCADLAPGVTTVHFAAYPDDRMPEESVPMEQRFEVVPNETKSLVLDSPWPANEFDVPSVRFPEGCGGLRVWLVPSRSADGVYWLDEVEFEGLEVRDDGDSLQASVPGIQNSLLFDVVAGSGIVRWGEPLPGWELPAEQAEVEVVAGEVTEVIVPARRTPLEFDESVDPTETISIPVRVVDPFGDPVSAIVTTDLERDPFIWTDARGEGTLELGPLAKGEERTSLRCSTLTRVSREIPWSEVEEQRPLETQLTIIVGEGEATLRTTVHDPMGEAVWMEGYFEAGLLLGPCARWFYWELPERLPWQWSANGRVPLKAGEWRMDLTSADGLWQSIMRVEARAGETTSLTATLPPRRQLEFSITLDGEPVALSACELGFEDFDTSRWTDSRGRLRTEVRANGPIVLWVHVHLSQVQNEYDERSWRIETTFDQLHGSTIELSEYPEED